MLRGGCTKQQVIQNGPRADRMSRRRSLSVTSQLRLPPPTGEQSLRHRRCSAPSTSTYRRATHSRHRSSSILEGAYQLSISGPPIDAFHQLSQVYVFTPWRRESPGLITLLARRASTSQDSTFWSSRASPTKCDAGGGPTLSQCLELFILFSLRSSSASAVCGV